MTSIVALDLSTSTGVAFDAPDGTRPFASTWRAPGSGADDMGWRFAAFEAWLVEVLTTIRPDLVAFEAPLIPRGSNMVTRQDVVRLLIGLASITEMVAYRMGIEAVEENVSTVKKHLAGSGRADKADMMAAAQRLGWAPKNHNEADSMALWAYCKAVDDPKWAANGTPLFAGAAAEDNRGNDHAPTGSGQRAAR